MNTRFKDWILSFYRRTVYKHKWLKGPLMVLCTVLLFINRVGVNIYSNGRKLMGVAFTLTFAFVSCSFSGVIWGNETTDFADESSAMYTQTEGSNAELADEVYVDESLLTADADAALADSAEDDETEDVEALSGADILDSVDIEALSSDDEAIAADDEEIQFDRDDWKLVLINKQHPIADDYTFELGTIKGSMQCDKRVLSDLLLMIDAAYKDGVNLVISSPYRPSERQVMLFNRKITAYKEQGMSYMDAYKLAAQAVTVPGCSEHEVGLAFDITCDSYSSLNAGFGDTTAGKWLAEHSKEYGFILRYPLGKEDITGIEYEPWHFRYVGKSAAAVITDEDITLEEFWEKYL